MQVIENTKFKAVINEQGAELTHLYNKEGDFDYIWNNKIWPKHAPVLFPAIGRSEKDKYIYDNKIYDMPQHGFTADQTFLVSEKKYDSVSMSLIDSDSTQLLYPFKFELVVKFTLNQLGLDVSFKVINNGNKKMGFSIGSHPAFNLPIDGDGEFEDYKLEFIPSDLDLKKFEIVKKPAPYRSGKLVPLSESKGSTINLNYDMFESGLIIIENEEIKGVKISSDKSKHSIEVSLDDFRYVCLWTKEGAKAPYLCVEPFQGLPDVAGEMNELLTKKDNIVLEPSTNKEFSYSIGLN